MTPATLRNLLDAVRRTSGIPVIMGPTAAGKSELAFALAREVFLLSDRKSVV